MLTPTDIENKVFKKAAIGGYDVNDVELFIEKILDDYEALIKENSDLKDEIEKGKEKIA